MKQALSLALVLVWGLSLKVAQADFVFGTPTNLGSIVNSSAWDGSPAISADGLTLYFRSMRPGPHTPSIWRATRATKYDPWNTSVNSAALLNSGRYDNTPCISADGLTLYFSSGRNGGHGNADIWVCTRETTERQWGAAKNLGELVNSLAEEWQPSVSADGLPLFFGSNRAGGYGDYDMYVTMRPSRSVPWGPAENLGPTVNHERLDGNPNISADGLTLFFASDRPGGYGSQDLWMTTRVTTEDPWTEPVNLGPRVNSSATEAEPSISADGQTLYFSDWPDLRPGGFGEADLWQVSIEPMVDFNNDGIVNIKDLTEFIEHWGLEDAVHDLAPPPFGDGLVDEQDLEVLMDHWDQAFGVIAHWMLDEAEGDVAYDSAGLNDAALNGNPLWQPLAGMIDGALEFDGSGDYVAAPKTINPADGPFSVFAWIKGGGPGQVIMSQISSNGVNWLTADSLTGCLRTELKGGRRGGPLESQTVIADGNWHRVGFTWDGSNRVLYVDDVVVAEDTLSSLAGASAGLFIGASRSLEPGKFWSGLIDDVRIYDRVVKP